MLRKRFIFQTLKATMIIWSDYSNKIFHIIFVFLDALRTPNYSLEEILIISYKMQTGLHKHHFYVYRIDFAIKRGRSACATTSLNAFKTACNLVVLWILVRFLCK